MGPDKLVGGKSRGARYAWKELLGAPPACIPCRGMAPIPPCNASANNSSATVCCGISAAPSRMRLRRFNSPSTSTGGAPPPVCRYCINCPSAKSFNRSCACAMLTPSPSSCCGICGWLIGAAPGSCPGCGIICGACGAPGICPGCGIICGACCGICCGADN